jgi:hypothetical protein
MPQPEFSVSSASSAVQIRGADGLAEGGRLIAEGSSLNPEPRTLSPACRKPALSPAHATITRFCHILADSGASPPPPAPRYSFAPHKNMIMLIPLARRAGWRAGCPPHPDARPTPSRGVHAARSRKAGHHGGRNEWR